MADSITKKASQTMAGIESADTVIPNAASRFLSEYIDINSVASYPSKSGTL